MGSRAAAFATLVALCAPLCAVEPFQFSFDQSQTSWSLTNGLVTASLQLTSTGLLRLDAIGLNDSLWQAPANTGTSPIKFAVNGQTYDATTRYLLIDQYTEPMARGGLRQVIVLQDLAGTVQVSLSMELFTGQPVVRFHSTITNLSSAGITLTAADMLPLALSDNSQTIRVFAVDQWAVVPRDLDFETLQFPLNGNGTPLAIDSGAHGAKVSWLALRDPANHGIFAGWEFNGRSAASVQDVGSAHAVVFTAPINSLNHPLAGGASFAMPAAFLGFYQGDWDEAGYRTQRFVEASLARPAPDLQRFPYMSWDSWGFQEQFDENVLRANAQLAANVGVELFIVDLGWSRQIGDWYADPAKFPSGLRAFSDYVHSLGMKFGLHITPAEVSPTSPVFLANPDWASTENDNYFNSVSICLSNEPARKWLVDQIVRVIDDYNVDWLLQDGENMVKSCDKATHTHDPLDSNYANSVQGIDAVVEQVLALRPAISWENCENGGNMMTFKMVQNYVTSIANDASGALGSRQGAFGATYPFSPRFVDRYSPEPPITPYNTQSYMFGGPWHLMTPLDSLTPDQLSFAAWEIAAYKSTRGHIRDGKVFHLTAAPGDGRIDAIESSFLGRDLLAIVTREGGDADTFTVKFRGASTAAVYDVRFQNDARIFTLTGAQLAADGVLVNLPDSQSSEIVYAERR